jgi:serine/threonine protein kinase
LTVAVKVAHVDQIAFNVESDELDRVFLEAALLSQLDHPSLAEFIESFSLCKDSESFLVIIQEFLVGSVCRLCREFGPLPETVIAFVLWDILSALASMHAGIGGNEIVCVHRDIKASNILLSAQCETKLVDFGVATLIRRGEKKVEVKDREFRRGVR